MREPDLPGLRWPLTSPSSSAQFRHLLRGNYFTASVTCRWNVDHFQNGFEQFSIKKDRHLNLAERGAESIKRTRGVLFPPAAIVSVNACQTRLRWHTSQDYNKMSERILCDVGREVILVVTCCDRYRTKKEGFNHRFNFIPRRADAYCAACVQSAPLICSSLRPSSSTNTPPPNHQPRTFKGSASVTHLLHRPPVTHTHWMVARVPDNAYMAISNMEWNKTRLDHGG